MDECIVTINPGNKRVSAHEGDLLRDILIKEKTDMAFPCGGAGVCGKCTVKVSGSVSEPDSAEMDILTEKQRKDGIRLACRVIVKGDVVVEVHQQVVDEQILEVGSERGVIFEPFINRNVITVPAATLEEPVPDAERIARISGKRIKQLRVLRKIPQVLTENDTTIELICKGDEIIDIRKPAEDKGIYSVAVDIGTTTVAATLVDMIYGRQIHRNRLAVMLFHVLNIVILPNICMKSLRLFEKQ